MYKVNKDEQIQIGIFILIYHIRSTHISEGVMYMHSYVSFP